MTTDERRPPEPDVLELVADVVKAWREIGPQWRVQTPPTMAIPLDELEKVWPR